jgi:hypothetical protein
MRLRIPTARIKGGIVPTHCSQGMVTSAARYKKEPIESASTTRLAYAMPE